MGWEGGGVMELHHDIRMGGMVLLLYYHYHCYYYCCYSYVCMINGVGEIWVSTHVRST